jgi:hypothetical protein
VPEVAENNIVDRGLGSRTNTAPRRDGSIILAPDDWLEGKGDLTRLRSNGMPEFCDLGQPPVADGRMVGIGDTKDTITVQTSSPYPLSRASYTANGPLVRGGNLPDASTPMLASIPPAASPIVKKLAVTVGGYAAFTAQSPGWFFCTFVHLATGAETLPGPTSLPFQGATGQSYRVPVPSDVPHGYGIGLYLSEPGQSRPEQPGNMWRQRVIDPRSYFLPYYDFTGPYRHERLAPTRNETALGELPAPHVQLQTFGELHPHYYRFGVTQVDENGVETPLNPYNLSFPEHRWFNYQAWVHYEVYRPALSPRAVGWYLYCLIYSDPHYDASGTGLDLLPSQFYRAYARTNHVGLDFPLPANVGSFPVSGQTTPGQSGFGWDLGQVAPPIGKDQTGIPAPTGTPDTPIVIGAARPAPGRYYAVQIDTVEGHPALPSAPTPFDLGADEIPRIVFSSPTNQIANGSFLEVGANGLPLDYSISFTGGYAYMEKGAFVMGTSSPIATNGPWILSDAIPVDRTLPGSFAADFDVENPTSGALAGTVQLILRQLDNAGALTDTTIYSTTAVGQHKPFVTIDPTGTAGSPLAWLSTTVKYQLYIITSGATNNNRIRARLLNGKDHKHASRRVPQPGSEVVLSAPPEPPATPETFALPSPDRPKSAGTVIEHHDYESGIPSGWTTSMSGGATIATDAAAALTGSFGLRCRKTTGGSLATANMTKNIPATSPFLSGGRHDLGIYTQLRIASLVGTGSVKLRQLCRPSDGAAFAWIEASQQAQVERLTIDGQPFQAGNVKVNLAGTVTNVAVNSTTEVSTLTLSSNPTAGGTVRINLDDGSGILKNNDIVIGGTPEARYAIINSVPTSSGQLIVNLGGVIGRVPVYAIPRQGTSAGYVDTTTAVASRIASIPFPGWTVISYGNYVWFIAQLPGPQSALSIDPNGTGVSSSMTSYQTGAAETASLLIDRIVRTRFNGWTVARGAGNSAVFTADRAGLRVDGTYDPRSTGAAGTMVVTTPGSVDDPNTIAARIRSTVFTGWNVTGSGNQAIFTATALGFRQAAAYDASGTGATGKMVTTTLGTNLDLVAFAQDDFGNVRQRRLKASLSNSTVYNIDLTCSGAGTSEGVVSVWELAGATPTLLAEFDHLSLLNYPTGLARIGVAGESSSALTWDIYIDQTDITDRGKSYFRHHNAKGEFLPQLEYYGVPGQPSLQAVPVENGVIPVLPGLSYDLSAMVRYENLPASLPARPLYVTAICNDGSVIPMGDITGPNGLTGTAGWAEYTFPGSLTAPDNCYELRVNSRDVSTGVIVIQEIVAPLAAGSRRTYRYATSGEYISKLFIGTPNARAGMLWTRVRREIGALIDLVPGGTGTAYISSAPTSSGPWSTEVTDHTLVPSNDWIRVRVPMTGDGISSSALRPGSPYARYRLAIGDENLPIFLMPDGTEFSGGAVFQHLEDWSQKPVTGRSILPSGQPFDYPELFDPVGTISAGAQLWTFSRETKRYIEKNWKDEFRIDTYDEALTVKLSEMPEFTRVSRSVNQGGDRVADYTAKLGMMWVVDTKPLP